MHFGFDLLLAQLQHDSGRLAIDPQIRLRVLCEENEYSSFARAEDQNRALIILRIIRLAAARRIDAHQGTETVHETLRVGQLGPASNGPLRNKRVDIIAV